MIIIIILSTLNDVLFEEVRYHLLQAIGQLFGEVTSEIKRTKTDSFKQLCSCPFLASILFTQHLAQLLA